MWCIDTDSGTYETEGSLHKKADAIAAEAMPDVDFPYPSAPDIINIMWSGAKIEKDVPRAISRLQKYLNKAWKESLERYWDEDAYRKECQPNSYM